MPNVHEPVYNEAYKPDFTKSGKEMLVDLINYANRNTLYKPLEASKVMFSNPVAIQGNCNTKIIIDDAVGYRGFENKVDIQYNRLDINQVVLNLYFNGTLEMDRLDEFYTTKEISDIVKRHIGIYLSPDEIKIEELPNSDSKDVKVRVHVLPNSIAYIGGFDITFVARPIRLDTGIINTVYPKSFMPPKRHGLG